ncbi:MAG: hypothetical protein WAT19_06160 [Ferruginibacter sp.]
MKLLTLTVVREFEKDVKKLLLHAGVSAFTFMPVTGYKDLSAESLDENWFASEVNETDSLLFWAFVPAENVPKVEAAVQHFNAKQQSLSRIHLSILQIEKSI